MPHKCKQSSLLIITLVFVALVIVVVYPTITVAVEGEHPGQASYEDLCAPCHGYDGIPILPGTPNFFSGERLSKKNNELLQAIGKGKGDVMPPWEDDLNEQAQQNVLNYIKDVIQKKKTNKN